jgi:flagellar assembly factor FliW
LSAACELPEGSVLFFPEGLPGFESSRRFILLQHADFEPVLLLRNADDDTVSLPVVPAQFVAPDYELEVAAGDRELLGFVEPPRLGGGAVCLLVLVLAGQGSAPQCNLFAPIVINPANLRGKQVMQIGSSYPSAFPLAGPATGSSSGSPAAG